MARLKIATFNINGIRARLGALLEWLEREKPDIACLQELKAPEEAFPQSDLERLGYGAIWHGQKSWNGVAILARGAQPEERQRGLPDDPDGTQSRYLEADVHGLRVACLYLPNGNPWPGPKFDYKLAWFAALRRRAARLLKSGVPTVMCGDFNVVPSDELDIYNPASWRKDALLQPESREAWFDLLAQGWTDSIRAVHGDEKIYTFWDYFRKHWERDAGLRIDHLLLSPSLAPTLRDAGVDRWVRGRGGASDHAPTWVMLDTAQSAGAKSTRQSARKVASSAAKKAPNARGTPAAEPPAIARAKPAAKTPAKGATQAAGAMRRAAAKPSEATAKRSAPRRAEGRVEAAKRPARKVATARARTGSGAPAAGPGSDGATAASGLKRPPGVAKTGVSAPGPERQPRAPALKKTVARKRRAAAAKPVS